MKYMPVFVLLAVVVLAGCSSLSSPTAAPLPTVVLDSVAGETTPQNFAAAGGGVTASGAAAPAREAQLASTQGGSLSSINVAVGDRVQTGQVLAVLSGGERMTAAVTAAKVELLAAEQAVRELTENAEKERAQAQLRLAKAKDVFDEAQKRRGWKEYRLGNDDQIAVARADLIVAEDTLKRAQESYGGYIDNPEDNLNKAAALSALSAARMARDRAQANLNYLLSLPDPIAVEKADAELEVARTEMEAAQLAYDKLKDGPNPEALALATARVENAQAQLKASQIALTDLQLKAPFDGTVSKINLQMGEWAMPGQTVLVLADLTHMRVVTTDLSERDAPAVRVGQPVRVLVKALNQVVEGRVIENSPLADTLGGDVVYQTVIELNGMPEDLRAGMSVDVEFQPLE